MSQPAFFHDPTAPVQPDQYQVEFAALLDLYREDQPRCVLEIGVREGGTLYQWMKNTLPGAVVVAVDLPGVRWGNPAPEACNPDLWQEWARQFGHELHFIYGNSHSEGVKARVQEFAPFDFAFIDGDHSAAGVIEDLLMTLDKVSPDGVIALHDIFPDDEDPNIQVHLVWRLIRDLFPHYGQFTSGDGQTSRGIGVLYV